MIQLFGTSEQLNHLSNVYKATNLDSLFRFFFVCQFINFFIGE